MQHLWRHNRSMLLEQWRLDLMLTLNATWPNSVDDLHSQLLLLKKTAKSICAFSPIKNVTITSLFQKHNTKHVKMFMGFLTSVFVYSNLGAVMPSNYQVSERYFKRNFTSRINQLTAKLSFSQFKWSVNPDPTQTRNVSQKIQSKSINKLPTMII